MLDGNGRRLAFIPKADAAVLLAKQDLPRSRPDAVGPVFDVENVTKPIAPWLASSVELLYPPKQDDFSCAPIPPSPPPGCSADHYLYPQLTRNERLRLTMLWYYTRDITSDVELLTRLQDKAELAHESIGWEFAIVGLLGMNEYTRLATYGLPLAILPRRESTCAHTVNQPPGSVFLLPNMADDWRFRGSPHVEIGGLRSYAGVPLRLETEFGDCVALGSLCVASNTSQGAITKSQHVSLTRLADWIVADIVQSARVRRQRERRRMAELLANLQRRIDEPVSEAAVLHALKAVYPTANVEMPSTASSTVVVEGREPIPLSELDHGVWEDVDYLDWFIENANHQDMPTDRVVRVIGAKFDSSLGQSYLVVATNHFRTVFDDIDQWFIQGCANVLSQVWQKRMLTEARQAKEKFMRGMTHQLRTPIHGILGAVDLLAEELQLRSTRMDSGVLIPQSESSHSSTTRTDPSTYINTIKAAGQDLTSIVNSIITLNHWADIAGRTRAEALHSIDELEAELAEGVLTAMEGKASCHGASLIFNRVIPSHYDSLWVDLQMLRGSLLPLLVNAVQNTPKGTVAVTFSIPPDGGTLVVDVEDTGCGIGPENQGRIFDAYEKIDYNSIGAGLGLTLASRFAALLGGNVVLVSSIVNRGSHFRATFRQISSACTLPPPMALDQKLPHLPQAFYKQGCNDGGTSPCARFADFLTSKGLKQSEEKHDSIIVLDYTGDSEQSEKQIARELSDQIVICLVATSERVTADVDSPENLIYIHGPFLTAKLIGALELANNSLTRIKNTLQIMSREDQAPVEVPETEPENITKVIKILEKVSVNGTAVDTHGKIFEPSCGSVHVGANKANLVSLPVDGIEGRTERQVSQRSLAVDDAVTHASINPTRCWTSKPTVLLVDDNPINLRIITLYCKKRGLPHRSATNGLQAVEAFAEHQSRAFSSSDAEDPIRLVLMDLQMPLCDGIEATRQIRALEKENGWERCVLFIVTGQDSPTDRAETKAAGADDYFVKPVGVSQLDSGLRLYFPGFLAT